MKKITNQIRDLHLIESGLENNFAGVLSYYAGEDKVIHITLTFIYLDKNIYFFFNDDDDNYDLIPFEAHSIFTTIKSEKGSKINSVKFDAIYRFFSVSIKGIIKKIDDQKLKDDLKHKYLAKYTNGESEKTHLKDLNKILMIDTEEIQAFEEIGG
ncbi:MAG TPA: hypothetical protein VFF33_12330 [Ignavibacteriaceae bacterium]|nr:hypothetical protein [Ignavibacteriaceae bacterium]